MARDQRRLTAIISADVAGYSRLMGRDDSGTLAALKAHRRELIDPKIIEYGGRIVKTTGDGLLLEFPSVVDAVRCAVDVQRGMAERNVPLAADQRIEFRIGVNIGDIIIDGDDIFGDGVNVAARVQGIAEPGGICVSRVVRDQVLDKLSFTFDALGAQTVKNIARPVEVYRVQIDGKPPTVRRSWIRAHQHLRTRWAAISVAVLAFTALGSSLLWWNSHGETGPAPPAMSIGVTPLIAPPGDIVAAPRADALSRDMLSMLTRHSTLIHAVPVPAIAAEGMSGIRATANAVNVRYLVEGKISAGHDGYHVVLRLMNGITARQIWSENFLLKSEEATAAMRTAVSHLVESMNEAEMRRVMAQSRGQLTPNEYVLLAYALALTEPDTPQRSRKQQEMFEDALRRVPDLLPALVGLSNTLYNSLDDVIVDRARLVTRLDEITQRALNLDRTYPAVWVLRSRALLEMGQPDAALEASAVAIRLDPEAATLIENRAGIMFESGRPAEALKLSEQVIAMDPDNFDAIKRACKAYVFLGRHEEAITSCERARAHSIHSRWSYYMLIAAYAQLGDSTRAEAAKKEALRMVPGVTIEALKAAAPPNSDYLRLAEQHFYPGLRKAGIPER